MQIQGSYSNEATIAIARVITHPSSNHKRQRVVHFVRALRKIFVLYKIKETLEGQGISIEVDVPHVPILTSKGYHLHELDP